MATAKSKKNTTAEQPAQDKKPGAKRGAAKKPKRPPAFKKPSKKKRSARGEIPGLILLLIGIVILFCLFTTSNGTLMVLLRREVKGLFGKLAWLAALYMCALGVQLIMGTKWPLRGTVSFAAALVILGLATLLQVFRIEGVLRDLALQGLVQNYKDAIWQSWNASQDIALGGGALGALLAYPMCRTLDVAGSTLVLVFVIGILGMWIVRMFAPDAPDRLGDWVRGLRDRMDERREERRAEREMERREQDEALLVPLPEELLAAPPAEEPPRGRKPKQPKPQPAAPNPAPQQEPARQRPAAAPQNRQPAARPHAKLYIEEILPENDAPYFTTDDDVRDEAPDFAPRRRRAYSETYGAPDETAFNAAPVQDEPEIPAARDDSWTRPQQRSEDPGAPYREAFRSRRSERREPLEEESPQEPAAPAAQPEEEAPTYDEFLPEELADETYSGDDEYAAEELRQEPAAQEPAAPAEPDDEDDDDPFGAPWEPVAPEYDPKKETGAPVRRRRTPQPQGYFPKGDVTQKLPEIPKEQQLDRPDWKPPEQPEATVQEVPADEEYTQPPFSLLECDEASVRPDTRDADARSAQKLEETLKSFGVNARVIQVVHGPAITRYELQPAPGVKVSKIVNLTEDIALNMAAYSVRIEAPIPGKAAVGIELANDHIATVHLRDVLESDEFIRHPSKLAVALGKDIAGKRIIADLAKMPHVLIAGATGSGKSVCINTIIASIIYRASPEEVRMILIDPKQVELSMYNGIPHLLVPVVTDPKKASGALSWAVKEMDERYKLFADCGVRDIKGYNRQRGDKPLMPSIVVIIDELSDLMLVAPGEVEESIQRLAQLARACGIHLVIATQRPSVNVITGVIKANIPSRIAFAVSSQVDSRTILDGAGAEKLLGRGDMLYAPAGGGKPKRVQGCFVSDEEVQRVVEYVKDRRTADYSQAVIDALSAEDNGESADAPDEDKNDAPFDSLFEQAVELSVEAGQASISMLQRRLRIGYARAGRIIDEMARRNIIGQAEGAKPRDVLITREDFALMFPKGGKK